MIHFDEILIPHTGKSKNRYWLCSSQCGPIETWPTIGQAKFFQSLHNTFRAKHNAAADVIIYRFFGQGFTQEENQ